MILLWIKQIREAIPHEGHMYADRLIENCRRKTIIFRIKGNQTDSILSQLISE